MHNAYAARPSRWNRFWVVGPAALAMAAGQAAASPLPTRDNPSDPAKPAAKQPARQRADDPARVLNTANGLLGRGLFDLAIPEYEKFLAQAPEHASAPIAHYGLAVCLHRLGRGDEALEHLEPLTEVQGFQFAAEVDLLIGTCRMARGEYPEAAAALRRMRRAFPEHQSAPDAAAMLAESLSRAGEHAQAAREARQFAQGWPDSPLRERTDLFLAVAEINQGRDEQAQRVLEGTLERFPHGALADQATLLLAQCRHRRGLLGEAADAYRAVAEQVRGPIAADALLGLGLIALSEGRLDEAAASLDRLLTEHPDAACGEAASLARARVSLEQGDTRAARARLESLESGGNDDLKDDAAYWLAKCDLRDNRPEDAAQRLRAAARTYRESDLAPEIAYDTAIALVRAGDDAAAGRSLEAFEESYPSHPLALEAVATRAGVLHRLGEFDASRALCERYLREAEGSPRAAEIEFLAAENRYLSGDFARAERAYRQFAERHAAGAATEGDAQRARAAQFRLAMSVYRQDRWADAEPLLSQIAAMSPLPLEFAGALLALGDVRFQGERWAEAEEALTRYLDIGPSIPSRDDALMKLGLAKARRGEHEAALGAFTQVLQRHPDSVHALQARFEQGQSLLALGRDAEAREAMQAVLDADPESRFAPHVLMGLGTIARREGRHDEAAGLLARAGELGGQDLSAEAELQRGEALLEAGQHADAAAALAAFLEANPEHPRATDATARLVIALARRGEHARAIEVYSGLGRRASNLDAATRQAMLYDVAWSHRALGQADDAARLFLLLVEQEPADGLRAHTLLALGALREEAGETEVAAGLLENALAAAERAGEDAVIEQASYRLGAIQLDDGNFETAANLLAPFIERFRASELRASALLLRGEALLKNNRIEDAAESFQLVIDEHADSDQVGPALLRLGEATATLQLWSRSEKAFAAWLERDPSGELWFQARFGLGWARENQGRFDEARSQYEQVVAGHDGATAARAQFQIGQCLFAQARHADAATELLKVDILYAYPEWSAAALYEAGRCFMAAGRTAEAREQFEAVRTRFADTQWANLAAQRLADAQPERTPGR